MLTFASASRKIVTVCSSLNRGLFIAPAEKDAPTAAISDSSKTHEPIATDQRRLDYVAVFEGYATDSCDDRYQPTVFSRPSSKLTAGS